MSIISAPAAPQFIVVPFTGVQTFRRLPLTHINRVELDRQAVWQAAVGLKGKSPVENSLLPLIEDHIACDRGLENSGWIACAKTEAVFFRVCQIGSELAVDLVIDTHGNAGRMVQNKIECVLNAGWFLRNRKYHLASFFVDRNDKPRNQVGSVVMDFGNTASAFIFHAEGQPPLHARPVFLHNPFDPLDANEQERPRRDKCMLPSSTLVLRAPENNTMAPWLVLGKRAGELIATVDPLTTSLYAPKKYIRHWPKHLKPQEPYTRYRGIWGQQNGLFSMLSFVELAVREMLTLVVSSQTNPRFASINPEYYPQVKEILLTYPLTWREQDKVLFQRLVSEASGRLLVLPSKVLDAFRVELVCSEPVAVAAYALWAVFFQFLHLGPGGVNLIQPSLVSSLLGNIRGTQLLRILVVDIGGGSTDIALVEADWSVEGKDATVDVRLRVGESLRYNRAGDRLSHLLAVAIREFVRARYGVEEALDFDTPSTNPAFTTHYKRAAVSKIMTLVERAKVRLAQGESWILDPVEESSLLRDFGPAVQKAPDAKGTTGPRLQISPEVLQAWIEMDQQSMRSHGEPGFMDIFYDLEDLQKSLRKSGQEPHLVLLSGRTTRLPFIKSLVCRHLQMPHHRVRTLGELLPPAFRGPDHEDIDKLAVVHGAHRFRFGHPIRFLPVPEKPEFKRYLGVVQQTPMGLRLHQVLVQPGTPQPVTCPLQLTPGATLLLGQTFREDGNRVEVIAVVANTTNERRDIEVDLLDDYRVELNDGSREQGVVVTERVSGGNETIVDNFNDTGRFDREPDGFLRDLVLSNRGEWMEMRIPVAQLAGVKQPGRADQRPSL